MKNLDEATIHEWLNLDLDGELGADERLQFEELLCDSAPLRLERDRLAKLRLVLEEAREPVDSDFRRRVLEALPSAGWEARPLRNWAAMIALFVVLGGSAAAIIGTTAAGLAPQSAFGAAVVAVVDLFGAGLVTGAGLLGASWKGAGLAVGQWLELSWGVMAVFGIIVAALNALLFRMVRRRHRRLAPSIQRELERSSRKPH